MCVCRLTADHTALQQRVDSLQRGNVEMSSRLAALTGELDSAKAQVRFTQKELSKERKAHQQDVVQSAEDLEAVVGKLRGEMERGRVGVEEDHKRQMAALEARVRAEARDAMMYGGHACVEGGRVH